jgi:hypothetical protein
VSTLDSLFTRKGRQKASPTSSAPPPEPNTSPDTPKPKSRDGRGSGGRFAKGHKTPHPANFKKGHPHYGPKHPKPKSDPLPKLPKPSRAKTSPNTDSSKFRNDLFWVYKQIGGRDQLRRLIAGDQDTETPPDRTMLKEMLKLLISLYSKELDAQIKREQAGAGDNRQAFIFIMDGLGSGKVAGANIESLPEQMLKMLTNPDAVTTVDMTDPEGDA